LDEVWSKSFFFFPYGSLNARISADWKKTFAAGLRLIYDVRVYSRHLFLDSRLIEERLSSASRDLVESSLSTDYDLSIRLSFARDGHFLPKLNQQATLFLFWMTADGLTDGPNGKLPDSQFSLTIKW
jgi:hypothetical protein